MFHGADSIHGLGPTYQTQLASAEIHDHSSLLRFCRTRKDRRSLSHRTGIPEGNLENWTVQAELMRIPGLGSDVAFLLEGLGIRTFGDLKRQAAADLRERLERSNSATHLLSDTPPLERVASWIADAAVLTPKLGAN